MKTIKPLQLIVALILSATTLITTAQNLETDIDRLVSEMYTSDGPGISLLVAKNGKTIYKKAFGQSNLELEVPMTTDNVFELASITKQFTAVSILMLEEQGKLSLQDPITKFIPDYPTKGKNITVHHLLNHTSGVKSYTDMANFMSQARTDMELDVLIDAFKNEPMDFDPGEAFKYNNSGYILLGKVIEVASGENYEDYIEKNIFGKLGMTHSRYGSKKELIKKRARGYQPEGDGYRNADYLSMTLPHAAGSLMSTVEDMLIWQNSLNNHTLIKQSSLDKAINGSTLNDGEEITYGYGLGKMDLRGSKGYTHSGGIFGYTTNGIYLIDEDVYVIGLTNCGCKDVGAITQKVAAMVIGKPYPNYKDAITVSQDKLQQWVGAYEFTDGAIRHIELTDGVLASTREGSDAAAAFEIHPMTETQFLFEDGMITYDFMMADGNRTATFTVDGQEPVAGKGIDKAPPAPKKAITLSPEALKSFEGTYELAPAFKIVVRAQDSQLFAQATGQPEFEIFAEDEDSFFSKVVPASVDFEKDDTGAVSGLILHQGGQDMPGKKID